MPTLKLVGTLEIPVDAAVTFYSLMPKVFCCIEGRGAKVFVNNKLVRVFKKSENGQIKQFKLLADEKKKACRMYHEITGGSPLLLSHKIKEINRNIVKQKIGFEYVI